MTHRVQGIKGNCVLQGTRPGLPDNLSKVVYATVDPATTNQTPGASQQEKIRFFSPMSIEIALLAFQN